MHRVFGLLLALAVMISPETLRAQARGMRGGGFAGRSGPVVSGFNGRPGPVVSGFNGRPGPVVSGFRGTGAFAHPGLRPGVHVGPVVRFARPVVVSPFSFYPGYYSPFTSPFYSSYGWPDSYAPGVTPAYTYSEPAYTQTEPQYVPPPQPDNDNSVDLAYQVGRLSEQIAELRAEQSAQAAQSSQSPLNKHLSALTVLVFHDGHKQDIQNYAIVGQTLWILDEHTSTRIPLSDLDMAATQNENRQRGTRFTIPEK